MRRGLSRTKFKKLDSSALVDFIDMAGHTSLLVFKKNRTRKLRKLIQGAEIERLIVPTVRGNAKHHSLEEMLTKRCKIGNKRHSNFWLQPTQSEMYPDHVLHSENCSIPLTSAWTRAMNVKYSTT